MNLIIDIGNSDAKLAVYDGRKKVTDFRSKEVCCEKLEKKLSPYKIDKAIISSVRNTPDYIFDLLSVNISFVHLLSHKSRLPFRIDYQTPDTLGSDRIAAAAGATALFPGADILVIDAGTAITFDYLSDNAFKGGNISPGIKMRFRALNRFTGKLPLVIPADVFTDPGQNTTDAITAGVITGVTYEINEYIRTFKKKHNYVKIVLTGGDSGYLKNKINYQFTYVPDIVTDGLNNILEYNAT